MLPVRRNFSEQGSRCERERAAHLQSASTLSHTWEVATAVWQIVSIEIFVNELLIKNQMCLCYYSGLDYITIVFETCFHRIFIFSTLQMSNYA